MHLLDSTMRESPMQEVKDSLNELICDLDLVYHDCSIREDDLDFQSTIVCLKDLVMKFGEGSDAMASIMLRSELENIKAVLDDISVWSAPDFYALAYFYLHEDSIKLRDMENEMRNRYVADYYQTNFTEHFETLMSRPEVSEKLCDLMAE